MPELVSVKVPPRTSSGVELLAARALGEVGDGARDAQEVLLLGLLDDGNDEAPLQRHGDADVDVPAVADGVALHRGVDDRDACAARRWRRA